MGTACHVFGGKSMGDDISATRGRDQAGDMISAMELIIFIAALVLLAVLTPRFGADTHRSREWDDPVAWPAGIRNPRPRHRYPNRLG
jgi:hypothetical protein